MILSINTTTPEFGVAVQKRDGTVLAEASLSQANKYFGGLMPAIHFLMESGNYLMNELEAIIVATGPGSFTGLRVGLSVAKGISHALQKPVTGISSLRALASQIPCTNRYIAPVLDSRKGEVFTARFRWEGQNILVKENEETCLRFEELAEFLGHGTIIIGNDYPRQGPLIAEAVGRNVSFAPPPLWRLKASAVGAQGIERINKEDFDDPRRLVPRYMRPPDIRPNPWPLRPDSTSKRNGIPASSGS